MKKQKGFSLIIIIVILVILGGSLFYFLNKSELKENIGDSQVEEVNDQNTEDKEVPLDDDKKINQNISYNTYTNNSVGLSFMYPSNYPESMLLENDDSLPSGENYQKLLSLVIKRVNGSYEVDLPRVYVYVERKKFGKGGGVDQEGLMEGVKKELELNAISKDETGLGKDVVSLSIKKIGKYDWVELETKSYYVDTYIGNTKTYMYEDNFIQYRISFNLTSPEDEVVFRKILESMEIDAYTEYLNFLK